MSFLLFLVLLFVIFFIVVPLLRLWNAVLNARRKMREMFNGGFGGADGFAGDQETDQPSYQRASKKKIEKDVGEYVDFEEVACRVDKTTEATTPDREQPAESQIEDIEWVDVPDKRK